MVFGHFAETKGPHRAGEKPRLKKHTPGFPLTTAGMTGKRMMSHKQLIRKEHFQSWTLINNADNGGKVSTIE